MESTPSLTVNKRIIDVVVGWWWLTVFENDGLNEQVARHELERTVQHECSSESVEEPWRPSHQEQGVCRFVMSAM